MAGDVTGSAGIPILEPRAANIGVLLEDLVLNVRQ
jgi:hypothetical protein